MKNRIISSLIESENGVPVRRLESKSLDASFEILLKALDAKDLSKLKEILDNGFNVNYREPARAYITPLIYAAKYGNDEAVKELLKRKADTDLIDDKGVTPLHAAAANGHFNTVQILLDASANPNPKDINEKTPLHYVSQAQEDEESSPFKVIETLINAGGIIWAKDKEERTPLHCAALIGNAQLFPLLCGAKASLIYSKDKDGRTPLHLAVLGGRSILAVKILLQYNSPIDERDNHGRTALHHVAARPINYVDEEFDGICIELLLSYGASVNARDGEEFTALSLALQKTMWWNRQSPRDAILHSVQLLVAKGAAITDAFDMWRAVETFPSLVVVALNQSIKINTSSKDSPHLELKLDFRPLTLKSRVGLEKQHQMGLKTNTNIKFEDDFSIPAPLHDDSDLSMLHYILWAGQKTILTHPLCSAFLHLKWLKVRKFLIMNVAYYFIFVIAFSAFALSTRDCELPSPSSKYYSQQNSIQQQNSYPTPDQSQYSSSNNHTNCAYSSLSESENSALVPLMIISITLIFREVLQFFHNPRLYIKHYENYIDLSILTCILMLMFKPESYFLYWKKTIGPIVAVCAWSRLMLFMGQFPSCGVYIVMVSTVCKTMIKFLAMYLPLLIAFALAFCIMLKDTDAFKQIPLSIVTTVVMMTGEFDYENKVLKAETVTSKLLPCIILILFILMVYIILSNLLVALAVSDLQSIQQRSEVLRLTRQVELMVTMESFAKSIVLPRPVRAYLQKKLLVSKDESAALLVILPNLRFNCSEKVFNFLTSIFGCRRLFISIFRGCVTKFIPPDPIYDLPKSLINESVQIALTEHEIEKREKRIITKSRQNLQEAGISSIKRKFSRKGKVADDEVNLRRRGLKLDQNDAEAMLGHSDSLIRHSRPIRASIWRANFRGQSLSAQQMMDDKMKTQDDNLELNDKIEKLQESIDTLLRLYTSGEKSTKKKN